MSECVLSVFVRVQSDMEEDMARSECREATKSPIVRCLERLFGPTFETLYERACQILEADLAASTAQTVH